MRVLLLSQAMDEDDWLRAFMVRWAHEIAGRVDQLVIITQELGRVNLPDNVEIYSLGKEKGYSRLRMVIELQRHLLRLAPRIDRVFAHMNPRMLWLSAPILALLRKKSVLWYCHPSKTWDLYLGRMAAWRVACAVPDCFPLPTPKKRVIGQGIDFGMFSPPWDHEEETPPDEADPIVLYVARLGAIKHQATVLRALARGLQARALFIGGVPAGSEKYAVELRQMVQDLGLGDRAEFHVGLPHRELPPWYRQGTVGVNLSVPGTFDKTVLEGYASGLPVVTCNEAFANLMGDDRDLLFLPDPNDDAGLAERLAALLTMSREERRQMGERLRETTRAAFDIDEQMDRLVKIISEGEL